MDIFNYSGADGKKGHPYLLFVNPQWKVKGLYAKKINNGVTIKSIDEPIQINEEHYREYLEKVEGDDEDGDFLVEYHERIEKDFTEQILND